MVDVTNVHLNAVLKNLGQDLVVSGIQPSLEKLADVALSGISKNEAILIQSEGAEILAKHRSDGELSLWWESGPSEVYFHRVGDIRAFLELIIKRLKVLASA